LQAEPTIDQHYELPVNRTTVSFSPALLVAYRRRDKALQRLYKLLQYRGHTEAPPLSYELLLEAIKANFGGSH